MKHSKKPLKLVLRGDGWKNWLETENGNPINNISIDGLISHTTFPHQHYMTFNAKINVDDEELAVMIRKYKREVEKKVRKE